MVDWRPWGAIAASAICMAVSMSAVFMGSFPVFLEPVSRDLAWGRAVLPQIITVISLSAAVLMPLCGRLVDQVGVRIPVALGLTLVASGMGLLSLMRSNGAVFWIAALLLGAGAALSGPPAFVGVVSSWFDKNRALALGFVLSIAPMCSQAIVAPLAQHLLVTVGWRTSYRMLALVVFVVGSATALFLLRRNPTPASDMQGPLSVDVRAGQALRTRTFWQLAIASALASGALIGFSVHVVSWLTGRSVAPAQAALVLSALFLSGVGGTVLSSYVADRSRSIRPIQLFYALPLAGLGLMAVSNAVPALILGAALVGLGMSAVTGLAPFLVTRYFGLGASAEIFGIVMAMSMASIGLAPLLIGLGFDRTGGYGLPIALTASAVAMATIAIGLLPRANVPAGLAHDDRGLSIAPERVA